MQVVPPWMLKPANVPGVSWLMEIALPMSWMGLIEICDRVEVVGAVRGICVAQ
jgi:hypothetical protein